MVADWRLTLSPQVMYDNISHVWIKILLNIKFMDCCMIQTKSWAKTVFKTTACSPTNFEVEFSAPGRPWKAGRSVRLKYPYCAKNMLPFSKCFEKIVFPKKVPLGYDLFCNFFKDGISFSPKYDIFTVDRKWKMIFLKK